MADFGKVHISGFLAWLSWLFIHIFFLIGFRNRIIVMIQWAWSYFTYDRSARLITGESRTVTVPAVELAEELEAMRTQPGPPVAATSDTSSRAQPSTQPVPPA